MPRLNIHLTDEDKARLRRVSYERGTTQQQIVTEALSLWFGSNDTIGAIKATLRPTGPTEAIQVRASDADVKPTPKKKRGA